MSGNNIDQNFRIKRLFIFYTISSILLVLSAAYNSNGLKSLMSLVILAHFLLLSHHAKLCLLMLWLPFINLITIRGVGFSLYTILIIVYVLHKLLKLKSFKLISLFSCLLLAMLSLMNLQNMGIKVYIAWIINLLLILVVFSEDYTKISEYRLNSTLASFLYGVLVSSILGIFVRVFFPDVVFYFKDYSAIRGMYSLFIVRFSGFMYDPNYYAQSNLLALAAIIILLKSSIIKSNTKVLLRICFVILTVFGLYSYSKMYILVYFSLILLLVSDLVLQRKISMISVFTTMVIITIVAVALYRSQVIIRYLAVIVSRLELGDITSGRLSIIYRMIDIVSNDITLLLIGGGFGNSVRYMFDTALHNVYFETLFSYGFFGSIIYAYFIIHSFGIIPLSGIKISYSYLLLPIIIIFITGFAIDGIWADWHYMYIIIGYYCYKHFHNVYSDSEYGLRGDAYGKATIG